MLKSTEPATGVRVFSPATRAPVRKMLQMAAGPGGTGQKAQTVGYSVGGKSGTARKQVGKSYATNKYRAWFTGMAPIDKPRIIVAVMIDEPSNGVYYGGTVAAPVFSEVVQQTLRMMGVQPDMAVKPQIVAERWRSRSDDRTRHTPCRPPAVAARTRHRRAAHRQPPGRPGDGFIAWPGAATDGRKHVRPRHGPGRGACLVEQNDGRVGLCRFDTGRHHCPLRPASRPPPARSPPRTMGRPRRQLEVLAVTGTNGKTSTAWWLAGRYRKQLPALAPCAWWALWAWVCQGRWKPPA
jgi:hypothetical protein